MAKMKNSKVFNMIVLGGLLKVCPVVSTDGLNKALFKYWVANEQVMFNLSNLFKGYREGRIWNVMAFAGAGVGRSMTYNTYALDYSAGVQSSWKVGKKTDIFVEAGVNSFDHNIDNCKGSISCCCKMQSTDLPSGV